MKTLIFVHGGMSFATHDEYVNWLRKDYVNWVADEWKPSQKKWRPIIAEEFVSRGGRVYMPEMPCDLNAKYDEWRIIFDGLMSTIEPNSEVNFVGHSLGGCFLLKYFSEQNQENSPFVISSEAEKSLLKSPYEHEGDIFSKVQEKGMSTTGQKRIQINQIHLHAACISEGDFTAPDNYEYLQQLGNRVHIWHAEDDTVVPFATAEELSRTLPEAQKHFFSSEKGYGHFHGVERIPELEDVIFGK